MIRYFCLLLTLSLNSALLSQNPEARAVLKNLSDKYQNMKSVELEFSMEMIFPDESPVVSECRMGQKGTSYFFLSKEREVYCDGDAVWLYIPDRNEVQINSFEEQDEDQLVMTPLDLVKQYDNKRYSYDLFQKSGTTVQIEFKPTDRSSDYSKFRIHVDTGMNDVKRVEAFGKDGSKVILVFKVPVKNKSFSDKAFKFDLTKHPGIHVEDLRID